MKRLTLITVLLIALVAGAGAAFSQMRLKLSPVGRSSKVRLVYGQRSVTVDLDGEMDGSYGSMPGDPPHRFNVWFTAEKDGFLYLVAHVRSHSPISDKNAPCGGDAPESILWIKADRSLKDRHLQSEVYQSCSFNYYHSVVRRSKNGLVIDFGGGEKRRMTYDNRHPDKGLDITKL